MKWLILLKGEKNLSSDATEATKPPQGGHGVSFIGFVAPLPAPRESSEGPAKLPANDSTHSLALASVSTPAQGGLSQEDAMTDAEIIVFLRRLSQFTVKGLTFEDGERMGDKLLQRDRSEDDRHTCLECAYLSGRHQWRCRNWQNAGLHTTDLAHELTLLLQRCDGFEYAPQPGSKKNHFSFGENDFLFDARNRNAPW